MVTSLQQEIEAVAKLRRAGVGTYLAAVLLVLNVLDWALTDIAIRTYGTGVELNPIMEYLFGIGPGAALLPKVVFPIALGLVARAAGWPKWAITALYVAVVVYAIVVALNVVQLATIG